MKSKKREKSKTFKEIVAQTPDISNCYQPGLQAFSKSYRSKINLSNPNLCNGSVELDKCVETKYPQQSRWDHMLCYQDEVYFVEFHHASTGAVSTMLAKLEWLKNWLVLNAPLINNYKATSRSPFVWIHTGGNSILPQSNQARRIAQAGLWPVSALKL